MPVKIAISTNTMWNIVNFRANLIAELIRLGHSVLVITPPGEYLHRLDTLGCVHVALPMRGHSKDPLHELGLLQRYFKILRRERPSVYLGFTPKPNIYGSLAARMLGIPTINNIAGLGTAYINSGWLTRVVCLLYKLALSHASKVFFQNPDDHDYFIRRGLVKQTVTGLLPGSGVDLQKFALAPLPTHPRVCFLLLARLLREKGVYEYVGAARWLRAHGCDAEFRILGPIDPANPSSIRRAELDAWRAEGVIDYLGSLDDVRSALAEVHCVVLPSYREGTPRALLEAAAMGRVIITTDEPGCREVVEPGVNGFLCEARDVMDLASCMQRVAALDREDLEEMGRRGRNKVEREFDENLVIQAYVEVIESITSKSRV